MSGEGEIVGFAGLAGAGRTELALSIFGVRPRGSGEIFLNEQKSFYSFSQRRDPGGNRICR